MEATQPLAVRQKSLFGSSPLRHHLLIVAVVWPVWLVLMTAWDHWGLFATHWLMSVTMLFGSFIAGASSEGGGAVAFPVMTLALGITPEIARDFALLIQAVGMNAAACVILLSSTPIERRALLWAGLGGAVGVIVGMEWIAGLFPPPAVKLFFVSLWLGSTA